MSRNMLLGITLAALLASTSLAADLKSGPQVGSTKLPAFNPYNVTGEKAGTRTSLVVKHGANPVVMIFARDNSPELTALIKKIDACTAKNKDAKMGSFVVYLNDSESLADQLKKTAEKENIKNTILSIDNPAGPKGYKVAKDADVTVVLYVNRVVKANHAYKKGELKDKEIDQIVSDVPKILAKE